MTTAREDAMADLTDDLVEALAERDRAATALRYHAGRWRKAADEEQRRRNDRDRAIADARKAGQGVREIAREAGIDPTHVGRVLRREEER